MEHHFIHPDETIAELEKKAKECETAAEQETDESAALLLERAKQCRDWAKSLRTGRWTA